MALAALAVGLSALWSCGHTLLAHALFTLLLTAGFLVGAWHYVLDLEEKWHLRLWLKPAR
jgi:uncharacterized membrane protein